LLGRCHGLISKLLSHDCKAKYYVNKLCITCSSRIRYACNDASDDSICFYRVLSLRFTSAIVPNNTDLFHVEQISISHVRLSKNL
jgi:hypothetical protein